MTDSVATESGESQTKKKILRANYSDSYVLRCKANKAEDAPSVMLLQALIGCNVPHRALDLLFDLPDDSFSDYLQKGISTVVTHDMALKAYDMLSMLYMNNAFESKTMSIVGVLKGMNAYFDYRKQIENEGVSP